MPIVVAAVRAADEDAAKAVIVAAYDVPPTDVRWRFCDDLEGRSPFSDRFPKAWWMAWDSERTCACPADAPEQGNDRQALSAWSARIDSEPDDLTTEAIVEAIREQRGPLPEPTSATLADDLHPTPPRPPHADPNP